MTVYPAHTKGGGSAGGKPGRDHAFQRPWGSRRHAPAIIEEVRKFYESDVPIFAICLGHQLMALANGGDTHKLKYGHRGGNHPVKDLSTNRVYISSQNHGYVVDDTTLEPGDRKAGVCQCQ